MKAYSVHKIVRGLHSSYLKGWSELKNHFHEIQPYLS